LDEIRLFCALLGVEAPGWGQAVKVTVFEPARSTVEPIARLKGARAVVAKRRRIRGEDKIEDQDQEIGDVLRQNDAG